MYPPHKSTLTWEDITITLMIEEISDSFIKAIIPHEYPRIDGPVLEDMGLGTREIQFRCYFADTIEGSLFNDQIKLLRAMQHLYEYNKPIMLIHPVYGVLYGAINVVDIKHGAEGWAVCQVQFIEDRAPVLKDIQQRNPLFTREENITDEIEQSKWEVIKEAITDFINGIKELIRTGRDFITQYTDPLSDAIDDIILISSDIRSIFYQLDYYYRTINNVSYRSLKDYFTLLDDLDNFVGIPDTIARKIANSTVLHYYNISREVGTKNKNPVSYITAYNALANKTRAQFIPHVQSDTLKEKTNRLLIQLDDVIKVTVLANEVASIFEDDERKRDIYRNREKLQSWNILGEYTEQIDFPQLLTIGDIEKSLYMVREEIQQVIDMLRSDESIFVIGDEMVTSFTENEAVRFAPSGAEGVFISYSKDIPHWINNEILWDTDLLDSNDWYIFKITKGKPEVDDVIEGNQSGQTLTIVKVYDGYLSSKHGAINHLKKIAVNLQKQAIHIKLESERVIVKNIHNPTHLIKICTTNNLPYEYIQRILAINNIWNPNAVDGSVNIYAK